MSMCKKVPFLALSAAILAAGSLAHAKDNDIWACDRHDIYSYEYSTNKLTKKCHVPQDIVDIAEAPDGKILLNVKNYLYKLDPNTYADEGALLCQMGVIHTFDMSKDEAASNMAALGADVDGSLYVAVTGLYKLDLDAGSLTTFIAPDNDHTTSGDIVIADDLAYWSVARTWGGQRQADDLIEVTLKTGKTRDLGPVRGDGLGGIYSGLAYHYENHVIVGFNTDGQVVDIDPKTAQGTLRAKFNIFWVSAASIPRDPEKPTIGLRF